VGFTRAISELHLPRDFKIILTTEWQETIERYEPVQVSRTPKASPRSRKKRYSGPSGTRYGEFTIEADLPKQPRKKPFKVGDRVRTGHGTGTVVETDGNKYLVALDGQAAQHWEKEWGLRRA
jgi:hypothetical protein